MRKRNTNGFAPLLVLVILGFLVASVWAGVKVVRSRTVNLESQAAAKKKTPCKVCKNFACVSNKQKGKECKKKLNECKVDADCRKDMKKGTCGDLKSSGKSAECVPVEYGCTKVFSSNVDCKGGEKCGVGCSVPKCSAYAGADCVSKGADCDKTFSSSDCGGGKCGAGCDNLKCGKITDARCFLNRTVCDTVYKPSDCPSGTKCGVGCE